MATLQYQTILDYFLNGLLILHSNFKTIYDSNFATPMFTFTKNSFQWTTNNDSSKVD